jgi:hypothetical protein
MIGVQSHRIRTSGRGGLGVDAFFAMACTVHVLAVADVWAHADWQAMSAPMRHYQLAIVALSTLLFLLFMRTHQPSEAAQPEEEEAKALPLISSPPSPASP